MEYYELKKIIQKLIDNRKIYDDNEKKYINNEDSVLINLETIEKFAEIGNDPEIKKSIKSSEEILKTLSKEDLFTIGTIFELGKNYDETISFSENIEFMEIERLYTDKYYVQDKLVNMNYEYFKKYFELGIQRYEKNILKIY